MGMMQMLMGGRIFTPLTRSYSTGTGATETTPAGATTCVITAWSGGAGGSRSDTEPGQGGGAGGRAIKTVALNPAGGQTFTYTVGAGGAGRTGSNGSGISGGTTSVTSASPSTSISVTGGNNSGAGGVATGGDTNTTGGVGISPSGGSAPGGGAGGPAGGNNGTAPGGGGAGGNIAGNGGSGANGRIEYAYT